MEIRPTPAKPDHFDVKELKALIGSRAWARIRERLEGELERHREKCERGDGAELYRAQGAAAALRVALALPDQVLKEITAALK